MVEIGGKPILWHIMKTYAAHNVTEFIICLGYKGYMIKEFFANYFLHTSDITFDLSNNEVTVHQNSAESWKVTLVDTGTATQTGGRLKRVRSYLGNEDFCFTYGDGVGDIDITQLIEFHEKQETLATLTAVQPPGRFGALKLEGNKVMTFQEKPSGDGSWINGSYFVLSPRVIDYIEGDETIWERGPMEKLAQEGEMSSHLHHGYWQPMDTLRDKMKLEKLWARGNAPWKVW